jgi:hypothetical protein
LAIKNECVRAGPHTDLGTSTSPVSRIYANNIALHSIYVNYLRDGTSEKHIRDAFEAKRCSPSSVKLLGSDAFVNFDSQEKLDTALYICYLEINGHTHLTATGRNCDPDNINVILGFWHGRTTHMNKLYAHINKHTSWKVVYVQPVFWKKYPYFFNFSNLISQSSLPIFWIHLTLIAAVLSTIILPGLLPRELLKPLPQDRLRNYPSLFH